MRFEIFVAWKHLTRRRKSGFISMISLISTAGVAVGVMALIVVLGVMSGFDRELKTKIVSVQPHLSIEKIGGVDDPEGDIQKLGALGLNPLVNAAPYVEGQAILRSGQGALGVMVKGIDLEREDVSVYQKFLTHGRLDLADEVKTEIKRYFLFLTHRVEQKQSGILLGSALASFLNVHEGETVQVISPHFGTGAALLKGGASIQTFSVRGIFHIGMNDFDSGLVLLDLHQAQQLYQLGNRVSGISLRFRHVDDALRSKWLVQSAFPSGYLVRSWYDRNENFFQALKVEKSVMTILLTLIILVAAFNIISTLIMVVMEKTRDIGILRALGATPAGIRNIFVIQGFAVGFMGIISGAILGLAMAFNLNPIAAFIKSTTGLEVFPSNIYYFDRIPVEVNMPDVLFIVAVALLISVLAGIYPAHRGAKLEPVAALRYE